MRLVPTCPNVPGDHVCAVCESDCDSTTALKMRVRDLEREVLRLAVALRESRGLTAFAHRELEQRFPERRAA